MTTEAIATTLAVGGICIMGLCVLIGSLKGELQEANEERAQAPAPDCADTICAWCRPGIDQPRGHGICPRHQDEMLANLEKESPRCRKTTES